MTRRLLPLVTAVALAATMAAASDSQSISDGVVNINTASAVQLQLLPGIGPAMAKRIIEFRETNGPFRKVDELIAVRGIGPKSMEKLRPYVVTDGTTTRANKVRSSSRPASDTNN